MDLPTHFELATLATTQPGTPSQQALLAINLWKACGEELERAAATREFVDAEDDWRGKWCVHFPEGNTVSLGYFLKVTMPNSKSEDRFQKFRNWNRRLIGYHSQVEGEKLDNMTAAAMARARLDGYDSRTACDLAANFLVFLEHDRGELNIARATAAAAAKNNALSASKHLKTPQADKTRPQAGKAMPQAGRTRPQADETMPQAGKP